MGIYLLGQGKQMAVYAYQTGIYMRRWEGHRTTRPVLLTGDYKEALTEVFWRETLYYGYYNQEGKYLVKNAFHTEIKNVLPGEEGVSICVPKLILFQEKLLVIYIGEKVWEGDCKLVVFFLGEEKRIELPVKYANRPEYQVMQSGEVLIIGVCYREEWKYYRLCPGEHWEELAGWAYWREEKREELEKLQCQSREEIEMLRQDLQYRNQLIESIKSQYEELMETATRYRDEAKKWRDKYVMRNRGKNG